MFLRNSLATQGNECRFTHEFLFPLQKVTSCCSLLVLFLSLSLSLLKKAFNSQNEGTHQCNGMCCCCICLLSCDFPSAKWLRMLTDSTKKTPQETGPKNLLRNSSVYETGNEINLFLLFFGLYFLLERQKEFQVFNLGWQVLRHFLILECVASSSLELSLESLRQKWRRFLVQY